MREQSSNSRLLKTIAKTAVLDSLLGYDSVNSASGGGPCPRWQTAGDGRIRQTVDVRYPDSTTDGRIAESCRALAAEFGATCTTDHAKEPFSVSADHPAVQTLLDVYREVTGRPAEPFSMGGGTYARNFARAVSFGPEDNDLELPAWGGSMHGPNECASEAQLKEAFKIYILAILRLMEVDL